MLVDVVLYGGELDLLKARMDYLQADYTVVVEGNYQFAGQFKGWTLADHVNMWMDKRLVYCPVESLQSGNAWENEFHQRNAAMDCLRQLPLEEHTVVGLFDTDEFPNRELLLSEPRVTSWMMRKHQGSAFWYQQDELTGVSGPWEMIRNSDLAGLRKSRHLLPHVEAGFHLSSFGTLDETRSKWQGFSHQELKRPDMDEWVEQCWRDGRAIENGAWLHELDVMPDDMPEYVRGEHGPQHWYRKRHVA